MKPEALTLTSADAVYYAASGAKIHDTLRRHFDAWRLPVLTPVGASGLRRSRKANDTSDLAKCGAKA